MEFRLIINIDNNAFEDVGVSNELGRILDTLSAYVKEGYLPGAVLDANGNTVGQAKFVAD
jgi:hypothetical protein